MSEIDWNLINWKCSLDLVRSVCTSSKFEFCAGDGDFKKAVCEHFLSKADGYGVYIVRTGQKAVYIGMAGTWLKEGIFQGQKIRGRLMNTRQGKVSANIWFNSNVKDHGRIVVECFVIPDPCEFKPAFLEAVLLQGFLNTNGDLPALNRKF